MLAGGNCDQIFLERSDQGRLFLIVVPACVAGGIGEVYQLVGCCDCLVLGQFCHVGKVVLANDARWVDPDAVCVGVCLFL